MFSLPRELIEPYFNVLTYVFIIFSLFIGRVQSKLH